MRHLEGPKPSETIHLGGIRCRCCHQCQRYRRNICFSVPLRDSHFVIYASTTGAPNEFSCSTTISLYFQHHVPKLPRRGSYFPPCQWIAESLLSSYMRARLDSIFLLLVSAKLLSCVTSKKSLVDFNFSLEFFAQGVPGDVAGALMAG